MIGIQGFRRLAIRRARGREYEGEDGYLLEKDGDVGVNGREDHKGVAVGLDEEEGDGGAERGCESEGRDCIGEGQAAVIGTACSELKAAFSSQSS